MVVEILIEPDFEQSSWGKAIGDSLITALVKKKMNFGKIEDISQITNKSEKHFLFAIGTDEKWLKYVVSGCTKNKIHPILLGGVPKGPFNGIFSAVTSDLPRSMYYLISYLKGKGRLKPALYGINPASLSDSERKESFLRYADELASENDVYYNNGSLKNCFETFLQNAQNYDCVICANDYSAISLIRNLKETGDFGDSLLVVSYGDTMLSKRMDAPMLTVSMRYEEYGDAAVSICKTLEKNSSLLYMSVAVKWKISKNTPSAKNEYTDTIHSDDFVALNSADEIFYSDNEMREMILVENMLLECDALDLKILDVILSGGSYENAAENCFISQNTAKYRIKKLMNLCNTKSKRDFLKLIEKYC